MSVSTSTKALVLNLKGMPREMNNSNSFRVIKREIDRNENSNPSRNIKLQEAIAGIAFHLFGVDCLPAGSMHKQGMQLSNCMGSGLTQIGFDDPLNLLGKAKKSFREFIAKNEVALNGRIFKNNVSEYPSDFVMGTGDEDVNSFSKVLNNREILFVYNTLETEAKETFVLVNNNTNTAITKMATVFGLDSCSHVHVFQGTFGSKNISYVKIYLKPLQLVILKNF